MPKADVYKRQEQSQATHSKDVEHSRYHHHTHIAVRPQAVHQPDDRQRYERHTDSYNQIGECLREHKDERVDRCDIHLLDGADLFLLHHIERWQDECCDRYEHGDKTWDDVVLVVALRIVAIDLNDAERYGG